MKKHQTYYMNRILIFTLLICIIALITFKVPVLAQTNNANLEKTSSKDGIVGLIGGIIGGLITSWVSYRYRLQELKIQLDNRIKELEKQFPFRLQELKVQLDNRIKELEKQSEFKDEEERRKEIAQLKRDYLNPLKLTAKELLERYDFIIKDFLKLDPKKLKEAQDENIIQDLKIFSQYRPQTQDESHKNHLLSIAPEKFHKLIEFEWAIKYVKDHVTEDYIDEWKNYVNKCNGGMHHFAFSTLYLMVCYLTYATKIRDDMPFTMLAYEYNSYINKLIEKINELREVFGTEYGIWPEVQDAIGEVAIKTDGRVINYKEFSMSLREDRNKDIFLRLCTYYWEIDRKIENIFDVKDKFNELVNHLESEKENQLNRELYTSDKKSFNNN